MQASPSQIGDVGGTHGDGFGMYSIGILQIKMICLLREWGATGLSLVDEMQWHLLLAPSSKKVQGM